MLKSLQNMGGIFCQYIIGRVLFPASGALTMIGSPESELDEVLIWPSDVPGPLSDVPLWITLIASAMIFGTP